MATEARIQKPRNFAVVVRGLTSLDDKVLGAAEKGMARGLEFAITIAKREHLSGPRPTVLDVITRRLRDSLESSVTRSGEGVVGRIGTTVKYARYHEEGFAGQRRLPAGYWRAVDARFERNGGVVLSGRAAARRQRTGEVDIERITFRKTSATVNYKGRPFLKPAIQKAIPRITRAVEQELAKINPSNG